MLSRLRQKKNLFQDETLYTVQIKCCKKIINCFPAADFSECTVSPHQHFAAAEFSVVVESHRASVRTCIVNNHDIAYVDLRELTLYGELVAVLAERAYHIVHMVLRRILFAAHGKFMICAVHAGAHQVRHACVCADILAVDMLFVDRRRDEPAVRSCNRAAAFKRDAERIKSGRNDFFIVELSDTARDVVKIDFFLTGTVRYSDAAAEINEFYRDAELLFYLDAEIEHDARGINKEIRIKFVRSDHGMKAEMLYTFRPALTVCFKKLITRKAVFCFFRFSDDRIAALLKRARIIAKTGAFRKFSAERVPEKCDMRNVVKIAYVSVIVCIAEFGCRCLVRCEHDSVPCYAGHI